MIKPRILLCGHFWSATIESCWLDWLKQNEYTVNIFDYDEPLRRITHNSGLAKRILWRLLREQTAHLISRALVKSVRSYNPDLVLVVSGRLINANCLDEIKVLTHAAIFHFYNEDFFNRLNTTETLRTAALHYDHFFTTKSFNVPEMAAMAIDRVSYIPHGYRPNCHYPVAINANERQKFGSDLAFVGTWEAERAITLAQMTDFDLRIWGGQWQKAQGRFPNGVVQHETVYCEALSRVINASKINLAFLRKANRDQHTSRTFEIPACGGFQLSERTAEILEFFDEGKEIECFSSLEELREKAGYYLEHEAYRKNMAYAGFERVQRSKYSFTDRLECILEHYTNA